MPRVAAKPSLEDTCQGFADLLTSATPFVARDRIDATFRKWLPRSGVGEMSENRMLAMMTDALLLSEDLLVSQPAASGTTALDRLAKSGTIKGADDVAALASLRTARFRLVRLKHDARGPEVMVYDLLAKVVLRLVGSNLPPLPAGTALFGRAVLLGDGICCMPGAITPLDEAAFAVAHGHPAAGGESVAAGARWAEAVYAHVVRHGTLDVPGLNRPADDVDDDIFAGECGELFALAKAWENLGADAPDAALLERTRQLIDLPTVIDALSATVLSREAGAEPMAIAFERLLMVQFETMAHRERIGSGTLTLDGVAQALDELVGSGRLSPAVRAFFAVLLQRLRRAASGPRADDPALERLVQRIQGLRAKTVAQGCTEQEALAAAEKVAELLDRYGLSLGELEFRALPCEGIGIQTDRRRFAPIDDCVPAIAAFFDCRVWVEQRKGTTLRYVFFGLRGDVTAAHYLYEMVERAFETETATFRAGELYARMAGGRRSATNSFQVGLGRGISIKLGALRADRDTSRRSETGRDLVPVKAAMIEEELAKLGLDLQAHAAGGRRRVLVDAFDQGEAAGRRFEVTPAITEAA